MKIVHFGQKHVPSREGGVEIVVEELAVRQALKGHEVCCINRRAHNVAGSEYDVAKMSEYKGIKLLTVPTIDKKGLAAVTSAFFAGIKAGFGAYDIVHIHAEGPAAFCWIPKLMGKKVVCHCHGLDWKRPKWSNNIGSIFIKYGERMMARHADEIIVLSRSVQDYFLKTYNRTSVFIPNGVKMPTPAKIQRIEKKWGLSEKNYILFLARLTEEKGAHILINAFKRVNTDKKLVIAGGSSDSEDYVKHLHNIAVDDDRIIFTGFVQGKELEELYSNAYIYVLPSKLEGMPLSLLEAMSYGNCCLVSDISENTDVVLDKGISFKTDDAEDLRNKIQELINNPEPVEEYSRKSAEYICCAYNWEDTAESVMDLYRRLC